MGFMFSVFPIIFTVMFVFNMAANFVHPVTPAIIVDLNLNDYMFGLALAAMMLFCGIFDLDPVTAPFSGSLSAEEDPIVRTAAANALHSPKIPEIS